MKVFFAICISILCGNIHAQELWRFKKEKNGIRAYTRQLEGYGIDEYKIEAQIDARLTEIVALMKDESVYTTIFHQIRHVKFIKNEDQEMEVYIVNAIPFPAKDRDAYVHSDFIYDQARQMVRIDISCFENEIPSESKFIHLKRCKGYWEFEQVDENRILIRHQFVADPGGSFPPFLANLFLVNGPIKTIEKMKELVAAPKYKDQFFKFIVQ